MVVIYMVVFKALHYHELQTEQKNHLTQVTYNYTVCREVNNLHLL